MLILSLVLINLFFTPLAAHAQCHGKERWPVKTGTDSDVSKVNTTPVTIGIDIMNTWNGGQPYSWSYLKKKNKTRISPYELQVYHIEGMLTWYKCECNQRTGDQDFHLVIQSDSGQSVIAEIPSPECVEAGSPFLAQIKKARAVMASRFTPEGKKQKAMVRVAIEGPAFFDKAHGQLGRADNSVEIHPVLSLKFK